MALLQFLVSKIKTPERKTRTCQLFNIRISFWFNKPTGTRYSRTSSC